MLQANQTQNLCSFFYRKSCHYEIRWKNEAEQDGPQMAIYYDARSLHIG